MGIGHLVNRIILTGTVIAIGLGVAGAILEKKVSIASAMETQEAMVLATEDVPQEDWDLFKNAAPHYQAGLEDYDLAKKAELQGNIDDVIIHYKDAVKDTELAVTAYDRYTKAWYALGFYHYQLAKLNQHFNNEKGASMRFERAKDALYKTLELDLEHKDALNLLKRISVEHYNNGVKYSEKAEELKRQKKYQAAANLYIKAIDETQKSIAIDDTDPDAWYNLGFYNYLLALENKRVKNRKWTSIRFQRARDALNKTLELEPKYEAASDLLKIIRNQKT